MILSSIVAYAKDKRGRLVIGKDNQIPWHNPQDLERFKSLTMGCPIVMGRKTHESIGKVLRGRTNIIITHSLDYKVSGAIVVHSLEEALEYCVGSDEAFIIGGQSLYEQVNDYVDRLYITEIYRKVEGDAFFSFPNIDAFICLYSEEFEDSSFTFWQRNAREG